MRPPEMVSLRAPVVRRLQGTADASAPGRPALPTRGSGSTRSISPRPRKRRSARSARGSTARLRRTRRRSRPPAVPLVDEKDETGAKPWRLFEWKGVSMIPGVPPEVTGNFSRAITRVG